MVWPRVPGNAVRGSRPAVKTGAVVAARPLHSCVGNVSDVRDRTHLRGGVLRLPLRVPTLDPGDLSRKPHVDEAPPNGWPS
ncbi:MAG: hypothetical protein ACI9QQ_000955 [Myxococcota bacterium]|jgi:hypothetical protein